MSRDRLTYIFLSTASFAGWAWVAFADTEVGHDTTVCVFHHVTGLACPSCGSTRAVLSILGGDLSGVWRYNPLGVVLLLGMICMPAWILVDYLTRKDSLIRFIRRCEEVMARPAVAISLVIVVLVDWAWNISKGL